MKLKFFNIILLTCTTSSTLFTSVGCSDQQYATETKNINGTDWTGWEYGKFTTNDYVINHKEKNVTYIHGTQIYATDLVIPDYVFVGDQQYKVLLGPNCFDEDHYLTGKVTFNIHTTSIPDGCFHFCDQIESIEFKNYITSFGKKSFYNCTLLRQITSNPIYLSKTAVFDDYCFASTPLKINFVFGSELKYIGSHAFSGVSGLGLLDLSHNNSLTEINDLAFYNCIGLDRIVLPRNLKRIGSQAFMNCTGLREVILPIADMEFEVADWAFAYDSAFEGFSRSCSFTKIGYSAFNSCKKFTLNPEMLSNPKLTEIGEYAFSENYNSILIIPNNIKIIRRSAFSDNTGPSGELNIIDLSTFVDDYPTFCGVNCLSGKTGFIYINKNSNCEIWMKVLDNKGINIGPGGWSFKVLD